MSENRLKREKKGERERERELRINSVQTEKQLRTGPLESCCKMGS